MPDASPVQMEIGVLIPGVGGGLVLFLYGMRQMTETLKTVAGGAQCSLAADGAVRERAFDNCRSETRSALRLSPLRSPILLGGALIALLLHVGMLFTPLGREILHVEPVNLKTFAPLWTLVLTVLVAREGQEWNCDFRSAGRRGKAIT